MNVETDDLYDLVHEAVSQAISEHLGQKDARLTRRLIEGKVIFKDDQDRVVKEVTSSTLAKKITGVREKLRVLEQKINNHGALTSADRAELQVYLTRAYGSLTSFNFLFRDERDRFKGTGR